MPLPNVLRSQTSRVVLAAFACAALLGLSFPPIDWQLTAWIALVPLGIVLHSPTMNRRCWAGVYLAGLAFHLWTLDWMRTLYGGEALSGNYVTGWLIAGQIGAVLFCLIVAAGRVGVGPAKLPTTAVLPLVWMTYEYVQSYIIAIFDHAGTRLVSLAHTQADNALVAQVADLGGAGLIGLIVAAVNGFCFDASRWMLSSGRTQPTWPGALRFAPVPLILIAVFAYGQTRIMQDDFALGPNVCLLGPEDLPLLIDERRLKNAARPSAIDIESARPDLIVWPELAYHHVLIDAEADTESLAALDEACELNHGCILDYRRTVRNYLEQSAATLHASLLIGCERLEARDQHVSRYNCLAFVDPIYGLMGCYDKQHLAPFTEFIPATGRWLQITNRKKYSPGQTPTPFVLRTDAGERDYRIGSALCYDIAFAEHFRQQLSGGIDFFVVAGSEVSDATGCVSRLLLRMARLRAIETRRPIVRNSHMGFCGLVDANGQIIHRNNDTKLSQPWQLGAVPIDGRISLYSLWGDWLSPTCAALLAVVLLTPRLSKLRISSRITRPIAARRLPGRFPGGVLAVKRSAFSFLELLVVVAVLGTIAMLIVPRITGSLDTVKEATNDLNRSQINAAVERWYVDKGTWPANNLSDIGADIDYFPEGIPTNPVDGSAYALNATTHRVIVSGGGGGK